MKLVELTEGLLHTNRSAMAELKKRVAADLKIKQGALRSFQSVQAGDSARWMLLWALTTEQVERNELLAKLMKKVVVKHALELFDGVEVEEGVVFSPDTLVVRMSFKGTKVVNTPS